MVDLKSIIKRNNETFHDHRLDRPINIWPRLIATIILSCALSLLFRSDLSNLLDGVITVQAILIGFSFSVMFFLTSSDYKIDFPSDTTEAQQRSAQAKKVAGEIFCNVAYFNLTAIACLLCALVLLLPSNEEAFLRILNQVSPEPEVAAQAVRTLWFIGNTVLLFGFYFLTLESGFTFSRTVARVNYLFGERLEQKVK